MFIHDPADGSGHTARSLQQAFGLTAAEAELTLHVLAGHSLTEAADARRIRLNTARTQLKSVFAKVGCHSQRELVWTLMSRHAASAPPP